MKPEFMAIVRQLNLFSYMCDATFERFINTGSLQRFSQGVILIQQNDAVDFLYILMEGKVEIFSTVNGRETTLDIIEPVSFFILAAVLNNEANLQSARILTRSLVFMIPAEQVCHAIENDSFFMRSVIAELSHSYNKAIRDLKNQKLRTSGQRLANWLLMLNKIQKKGDYVDLPVEKRLLASHLGMTPENLSRVFCSLSKYGIKVDGARVIFVDMKKFLQFTNPDTCILQH
ncbi:MAG: transcriptional activator FtrB [Candidatus Tokpelaia sp. JSC189]|nr:MAG: transcriptional activator FtrB [Candidatus Tokpelaia sp. JSC189]